MLLNPVLAPVASALLPPEAAVEASAALATAPAETIARPDHAMGAKRELCMR